MKKSPTHDKIELGAKKEGCSVKSKFNLENEISDNEDYSYIEEIHKLLDELNLPYLSNNKRRRRLERDF